MLLIFNPAMMARHWRRWAKTKLQALLRAWPWRSAGGFEMWLWEIVSSPLGLVIAVSEVLFRLVLTYIFLRWCECILLDCLVLFTRMWGRWQGQQVFCWDTNSSCGQQLSFPWRLDPAHDVDLRRMRNCAVFRLGRVLFFCCQFFGCFFRLATCKLLDDRPQMALSTGMFQLKKVWDGINW